LKNKIKLDFGFSIKKLLKRNGIIDMKLKRWRKMDKTLSDSIFGEDRFCDIKAISVDNVKDFIKKLKEELCSEMIERPELRLSALDHIPQPFIMETIDKLAGEKLVAKNG
jgi:hypothetical protein